jgi:hypothetical protein
MFSPETYQIALDCTTCNVSAVAHNGVASVFDQGAIHAFWGSSGDLFCGYIHAVLQHHNTAS